MTKKPEEALTDRRGFLKLAGLGGVAGGATLVATVATDAEAATADAPADGNYRESDHVKTFYQTARF